MHKKAHLPSKICPMGFPPLTWRKDVGKELEQIKYCSKRGAGL